MARMNNLMKNLSPHRGTYALMFRSEATLHADVGRLGAVVLPAGFWIYVGSAFGPGGLRARLAHHLRASPRPHWHLDYIKQGLLPLEAWTTLDPVRREHAWAQALSGMQAASRPVIGFGASDCSCRTHLIHFPRRPVFSTFKYRLRDAFPDHAPLHKCLPK
jgi:Uri superfamily endonuclease